MPKIAADELQRRQNENDGTLGSPTNTPEKSPAKTDVDPKGPRESPALQKHDAPDRDDVMEDEDDEGDEDDPSGDSDPDDQPAKRKARVH